MSETKIERTVRILRRHCIWQLAKGTDRDNGYPYGEHLQDCDICQSAELIESLSRALEVAEKKLEFAASSIAVEREAKYWSPEQRRAFLNQIENTANHALAEVRKIKGEK